MFGKLWFVGITAILPLIGAIHGPVGVDGGQVAGAHGRDPSITVFKGVPFAAPPVGDLRWRAPRPVSAWKGVKQADHFGPSCVQTITEHGFGPWTYEFVTHGEVSEDCLYLNVWTPAKSPAGKLPVYVFLYGGGFTSGSAEVPIYDGEGLARKGLVVVTINYRVGVFGFLAHPELAQESGHSASGNYGLLDQIAALRWVRNNISAFGGDAGRVTIAGQSAGSMSVHFLMASPLAKGLFHRAIAESGGSGVGASGGGPMMGSRTLANAEADGVKFAAAKGASSLKDLRAMSWRKLMEPVPGTPPGPAGLLRFSPIVDGYVLPESPLEAMVHGKLSDVPTLTGCNTGEIEGGLVGPLPPISAAEFQKQVKQRYGDLADEFLKLYPATTDEQAQASRAVSSRDESLVSMYLWARKRGQVASTRTFIYLWDHTLPGPNAARYGAFHTSEVPYVLDTLYTSDRPFTETDREIADRMSAYWAAFAASGDPNLRGLPVWPAVNDKPQVMEVGDNNAPVALAGDPAKLAFFEKYLSR